MAPNPSPPDDVRANLANAIESRDAVAFELAVNAISRSAMPPDVADLLAEAVLMPWHTRHEDVARALQTLRDPVAIESLFKAARSKHSYLDHDDSGAFARKCTWALADIGTAEARSCLEQLAACDDAAVAAYAQKRLERWEREKARKGPR